MLDTIQWIDDTLGLADYTSRQIAIITAVILGILLITLHEKGGIRWYSLIHAIISGYLSLLCVWTSYYYSPSSSLCDGPLTVLHRITPAITMGYGIFDIFEATTKSLSKDFLLHGIATFGVMAYFCENDIPEIVLPFLLMEISTVHLVFMKSTYLSEKSVAANMGLFVLTFFFYRLMICPYLWWGIIKTLFFDEVDAAAISCLPPNFKYFWLLFGIIFNGLNGYWGVKIILKVLRKINGKEKMKEGNSLKES